MLGIIGGFMSIHLLSPGYIERYLLKEGPEINVLKTQKVFITENRAITDLFNKNEKSIIPIKSSNGNEGSGVVISSDGLVLTLSELIPVGYNFYFFVNDEPVSYKVEKRDFSRNLALVRIDINGLSALDFSSLDEINNGEKVFLIGSVFGSDGIIKSVNEGIIKRNGDFIETNIIEDNKMLGSSLFDIKGRLLGINIISATGNVRAIPIFEIREFIEM